MKNRNVYKGHRYVPKIMGVWDQLKTYEGLSIVLWEGNSYTSKKRVPEGVEITNEEYWAITGNYNIQIENYRQEVKDYIKRQEKIAIDVMQPPYNAKGDGVTDDTQAIQQALDSNYTNKTILLRGDHLVKTLELNDNTTIMGGGKILLDTSHNNHVFQIQDVSNISIKNLTIDIQSYNPLYQESTVGRQSAFFIYGNCSNVSIDNVEVSNAGRDVVYVNETNMGVPSNINVTNIKALNTTRNAISIISVDGMTVSNCTMKVFGLCGVDIEAYESTTVNKNIRIENNLLVADNTLKSSVIQAKYIIETPNIRDVSIRGNTVFGGDNASSSVISSRYKGTLISDNTLYNYVQGINGVNAKVIDNVLSNPNTNPIAVSTTGAIYITGRSVARGNTIYGAGYNGIVVSGSNNSLIQDNMISDVGINSTSGLDGNSLYIFDADNNIIRSNTFIDTQETPTTKHGVYVRDSLDNIITDNISRIGTVEGVYQYVTSEQTDVTNNRSF